MQRLATMLHPHNDFSFRRAGMDLTTWVRLLLVYTHLLLCGYALYVVIRTDLVVLRRRIGAATMERIHHRVLQVLAGLWATGVAIVMIDLGPDLALLWHKPKLLAKFTCVAVLTLNALLLRRYCFPRLVAERRLGRIELALLSGAGAVSTTSWLMAAFIGVAKPMAAWSPAQAVGLYALVLAAAVGVSQWIGPARLAARAPRTGHTALEEAAETLDFKPRG